MFKIYSFLLAILTCLFFECSVFSMPRTMKSNQYIYGVTIDSIVDLPNILNSLDKLQDKLQDNLTVRIVFDEYMPPEYYKNAVELIHNKSFIMGELLDSASVKEYSVAEYIERANQYIDELGNNVTIWEIGNEVNGEWLGPTKDVVAKITAAYTIAKEKNKITALTLFFNENEDIPSQNKMFRWAKSNIPQDMKEGLDYVLVSYYPNDLYSEPDWPEVFSKLHKLFPNSQLGFGEIGTKDESKKADFINYFYSLKINKPYYIGGYFWWYFNQDMVPNSKPLHAALYLVLANRSSPFASI